MARGNSRAQSEAKVSDYDRLPVNVERRKERLGALVLGNYITKEGAEILKKDDSIASGEYYNNGELKREYGKDFLKEGWVSEKSDILPGAVIKWKNLGGQMFYKVENYQKFGGIPQKRLEDGSYASTTSIKPFDEKLLVENGGRYKTPKEAMDVLTANYLIQDLGISEGMMEAYERAGRPQGFFE